MRTKSHQHVMRRVLGERGPTAIIAIHDTTLGPALGGVRMWPYASEEEALADVLNLSRDMTYKAAAAGLQLGGGKAVIVGDAASDKTSEALHAFGRFVESLNGGYIASEDVGTEIADLDTVREVTTYVAGRGLARGGLGDPSPMTALGVFHGMRACLEHVFGTNDFRGRRVVIQGAGKVGSYVARTLAGAGAAVIITDVDEDRAVAAGREYGARICAPDRIYQEECDFFAPCALSGVIDERIIPRLSCRVIAGAANAQLSHHSLADALDRRGILYVPDYIINAGGLIQVAGEYFGLGRDHVAREIDRIGSRVTRLLDRARRERATPLSVADRMVEETLRNASKSRSC